MRAIRLWGVVTLAVGAVLLTGPAPASAEFQLDLYVGGALTNNVDFSFSGMGGSGSTQGMDVSNALVFGGRIGYWFDALPWFGVAVDGFKFTPDIPSQTVNGSFAGAGAVSGQAQKLNLTIQAVSFELKARLPLLKDATYPQGRLQPYVLAGPAVFFADLSDTGNFVPSGQSNSDTEVGVKAGAGVAFQIIPQIAVFGEYRFTHFNPSWSFTDSSVTPRASFNLSTNINTNQFVVGLSFRFPWPPRS
jgi:opacity protein-like surface antigen